MTIGTEHKEGSVLENVERVLQQISAIPYNNATNIYQAAGEETDIRMGGSCLFKLNELRNTLPQEEIANMRFITAMTGNITHYAMLLEISGSDYYLDPFLWQSKPMRAFENEMTQVETLQNGWVIRKEQNEDDVFLSVSLIDTTQSDESKMVTHRFTQILDFLPNPSALPLRPDLPSFMMQLPSKDGKQFFKMWYSKEKKYLDDIWVVEADTGRRKKVPRDGKDSELRPATVKQIEDLTGISEQEICDYFSRAHELEIELVSLLSKSGENAPNHHADVTD